MIFLLFVQVAVSHLSMILLMPVLSSMCFIVYHQWLSFLVSQLYIMCNRETIIIYVQFLFHFFPNQLSVLSLDRFS